MTDLAPSPVIEKLEAVQRENVRQPLLHELVAIRHGFMTMWPGDEAPEAQKAAIRTWVQDKLLRLNAVSSTVQAVLESADQQAFEAGVAVAQGMRPNLPEPVYSSTEDNQAAIDHVPVIIEDQVSKANILLEGAHFFEDIADAITVAQAAIPRLQATATFVVNGAANHAIIRSVETKTDVVLVWRTERNACVHCLAYAGIQRHADHGFPPGLTFGRHALRDTWFDQPPLHPNCRCDMMIVSANEVDAVSQALIREAQRSILRGWSLQSESEATRLYAAEELLKRGTNLPKSVKGYAVRAIKARKFPRSRDFPN